MKTNLTKFQTKVLQEIAKIPFGETRTYKQIAEAVGAPKAARAVGMACNKNPFPFFIPCHRVVATSGKLQGYAYGLELKAKILNFEKSFVKNLSSNLSA
jgi:methylated-DNA-[protein]-cysteine S-methyltransferase